MPTVPKVQRSSEPIANLPQIQTPRADPDAFGAGLGRALGSTVSAALNGASAIIATRNRIRERQAAEAADAALVEYNSWASGVWHGTPDPVTGQLTPGLAARQSAEAAGVASDYTKLEKEYLDNPSSPYAKLDPEAQAIFRRHQPRISASYRETAARHEFAQTQIARAEKAKAAYAAAQSAAVRDFDLDDDIWEPRAGEAALRAADLAVIGQVRINADGEREFSSPAAQTLHREAAAAELATLRKARALHFADLAADAAYDPEAQAAADAHTLRAQAIAQTLDDQNAADVSKALKSVAAIREQRRRAAEHAAKTAQAEAAQAERDRLHSVAMNHILAARDGTADPDAAITSLRNTTEPDLAKRLITDIILQEQSAAEDIQDAAAKARADRVIFLLKAGQTLDPDGNLVQATPPALRDAATRYFFDRTLTRAQYEEVAAHIQGESDARVKAFTRRAFAEIIPEFPDAFREDELGRASLDLSKLTAKQRPSKPGIKRQWFEPGAASGKPRTEDITFGHINEAVNTIRLALREDPAMTPDIAIERFRGLIRGTLAEHRDKKIEDAIGADAAFYLKMRETNAQTILRHLAPRE